MRIHPALPILMLTLLLGALASQAAETDVQPLIRAHAHNDYEHSRPLLDALEQGFCSVEADVHLVEGLLLVAHNRISTSPQRTLQSLYLAPLQQRTLTNRGRVHPGGPACTLLIDFKSEPEASYTALQALLEKYRDMLTRFENGRVITNAVTIIISGNRPRATLASQPIRWAASDGLLADLETNVAPDLVPLISERWGGIFKWRGQGKMPAPEEKKLRDILTKAHARGQRVRFWGAPDTPLFWQKLHAEGVDLINTDDLAGLGRFLRQQP